MKTTKNKTAPVVKNNKQDSLSYFEGILRLSQKALKKAAADELRKLGYGVDVRKGFVYAKGEVPVLLVAHLDTVHRQEVRHICYSRDGKLMMSPEGIGGDDRAGVYMALEIVKNHRCHVLFCEDEEIGGRGAREFANSKIRPEVNYIVEMDRRGADDAVFYDCENQDFTDFVCGFGFREAFGSFSDISVIAPRLGIAAVNISAGYYNEHSRHEYINLAQMKINIDRISQMVQAPTEGFEYIERLSYGRYGQLYFEPMDLWGITRRGQSFRQTKTLMPLPESAYLMINGHMVESCSSYYMDSAGDVYDYLPDLDAAVESEDAVAFSESGLPLRFSEKDAERIKVIPLEIALEMLG